MQFSNEHLNLPPLRRTKITPATKIMFGKYKGEMMATVIRKDFDYITKLGDEVDPNWTWQMLQLWLKYKPKPKYKALMLHDKIPFGKYKGITVDNIGITNKQYLVWLIKNTKCRLHQEVKQKFKLK